MTEGEINQIVNSFQNFAHLDEFKALASVLLVIALLVNCIFWFIKIQTGMTQEIKSEIPWTIAKIFFAGAIINSIEYIGSFSLGLLHDLSTSVLDKDVHALAAEALSAAFGGLENPGFFDKVGATVSVTSWSFFLIHFGLLAILMMRDVLLTVIWPVNMILVSVFATISLPMGVFPGFRSFRGWIMVFLQYSSWPIIIYLLTTIVFTVSRDKLERIKNLEPVWQCMAELQEYKEQLKMSEDIRKAVGAKEKSEHQKELENKVGLKKAQLEIEYDVTDQEIESSFWNLLKIAAVFIGFIILIYKVHSFAAMIFREGGDDAHGSMGGTMIAGVGMMAAASRGGMRKMTGGVVRKAGKAVGGAASALSGSKKSQKGA